MDDFNALQYDYDGTKLNVSDYTNGSKEAPSIHLNDQEYLNFQSYYGARTTLAISPSLFAVPMTFPHDQPNPCDSDDSGIAHQSRAANVTANHSIDEFLTEVQTEPMPATVATLPTTILLNKPSRRRYSPEKWAIIQLIVESLYIDQGRPLHETMRILEEEHSFKTSEKQLKNRIKDWGYTKNKKAKTIDASSTSDSSPLGHPAREDN